MNAFTFSFPTVTSVINLNSASCTKLQEVMGHGATLIIKAYTNRDGYPVFKIDSVQPHKTDEISIPAYDEILNKVYNYLRTGTPQEIVFSEEDYENSKRENSFSFELFKAEVENGVRITTQAAFIEKNISMLLQSTKKVRFTTVLK